jgi:hypothetical protein
VKEATEIGYTLKAWTEHREISSSRS